jgi:hypothetical protein
MLCAHLGCPDQSLMPAKANVHINNYPKIEDECQVAKGFAIMNTFCGQYFALSTLLETSLLL